MSSYYYPPPPPPPISSSSQPAPPPGGQQSGNSYPNRGGRGARHGGRGGNHPNTPHQRYPPPQYGSANNTSQWNYQTQQFSAPLNSNEMYPGWSQPGNQPPSFQHYPPSSSPYVSMPAPNPQPYAYAGVPVPPPPLPQSGWNAQANAAPPPLRLGFNERPRSRAQHPPRGHGAPAHFPGQKRKRENSPSGFGGASAQSGSSSRGSLNQRGRQSQERKPKVPAPPPVPNYGFAGLPAKPPPPVSAQTDRGNLGKKRGKKRKTNQLGLTPKTDIHEASDPENEEDEEAVFAKLGAPANVAYRGRVYDISTNADVEAWIAERKKRFPTQARIAEKKAAEEKAKQQREARKKLVAAQRAEVRANSKTEKSDSIKKRDKAQQDPSRQQELKRKKMEDLLRQANKLRAELEGADPNDEKDAETSKAVKDSQALDGIMSSDDSNDMSADENSDDGEAPDVQSSKVPNKPAKQMTKPVSGRMNTNIPCKYYLRDGHCRRKDCRFLHHIPDNVARKSLYERLTEQEFRSVGLKALQVIKELGDVGYFDVTIKE